MELWRHYKITTTLKLFFCFSLQLRGGVLLARREQMEHFRKVEHLHVGLRFGTNRDGRKRNLPHGRRFLGETHNHRALVPFHVHVHDQPAAAVHGQRKGNEPPQSVPEKCMPSDEVMHERDTAPAPRRSSPYLSVQ